MRFPFGALLIALATSCRPRLNDPYERAALREIAIIHGLETNYHSQFGRYAARLAELERIAGTNIGYTFTVQATSSGYAIRAVPDPPGRAGRRSFYSDQTLIIREGKGVKPANESSPVAK
jgi:hypothetical protein